MMRSFILPLSLLVLCAACGAKGALEKPAGSVPPPLIDQISRSAPSPADVNVNTPPKSQE
ncbi:MAG: hypothetical protein LBS89_05990 [Zoogloeaceae bacterium]|jgi:predicted small lipoprotein YifL|nr:hypothetical protein [Zoogloeaceae bacterium]